MAAKAQLSDSARQIEEFMERKALNNAPAWRPEPGTMMTGEVIGRRMGQDNGFGQYPVIIYRLDDGNIVALHAFHTMVRDSLREVGCEIGQRHMIAYDGEKTKNNASDSDREQGRDKYHMYYVEDANKPRQVQEDNFVI